MVAGDIDFEDIQEQADMVSKGAEVLLAVVAGRVGLGEVLDNSFVVGRYKSSLLVHCWAFEMR